MVSVPPTGPHFNVVLGTVVNKLFSQLMIGRLTSHVSLHDHQYGFRKGRGTFDALFSLHAAVEPRVRRNQLTYLLFLDWSKAYDRVMHDAFLTKLAEKGVTGKAWRLVDAMYRNASSRVRLDNYLSEPFPVSCGVAQGCPLSPFLYSVFMDDMLTHLQTTCNADGLVVGDQVLVTQAYADDCIGASGNAPGLQHIIREAKAFGDKWGCVLNVTKSAILVVGNAEARSSETVEHFWWGCQEPPQVQSVRYLGVWLTNDWTWDKQVAEAKQKGLKAFFKWSNVLTSPRIHVNVKMRVVHSVIRPVMEYGMEVWGPPTGNPQAQLAPLDEVLQMACRVAAGVRSYAEEPAWTRRQCVTSHVMLSTLCCMPMDAACDVARFRYAERLRVSHARRSGAIPEDCDSVARRNLESLIASLPSLHFRDHAYTHMDVEHPWWTRASRAPTPAQNEPLSALRAIPNSRLTKQVVKAVTAARRDAIRAKPTAPDASAAGRTLQRPSQEPHFNPVHDSLGMPDRLPAFLRAPDTVVYPLLAVQSARLPCTATVRWDDCFRDGMCPRPGCDVDVDGSVGTCMAEERR